LTGTSLNLDELVAVARKSAPVQIDAAVAERMRRSRAIVERALATEAPIYGLTTGVASLKRVQVEPSGVDRFNQTLVREHRVGQGATASPDVARAAMLLLANQLASSVPGVRPLMAERLVACLNVSTIPGIRLVC